MNAKRITGAVTAALVAGAVFAAPASAEPTTPSRPKVLWSQQDPPKNLWHEIRKDLDALNPFKGCEKHLQDAVKRWADRYHPEWGVGDGVPVPKPPRFGNGR